MIRRQRFIERKRVMKCLCVGEKISWKYLPNACFSVSGANPRHGATQPQAQGRMTRMTSERMLTTITKRRRALRWRLRMETGGEKLRSQVGSIALAQTTIQIR
jgi:hypothetical protein